MIVCEIHAVVLVIFEDKRWVYIMRISVFFFKEKTAYEMSISDWSSDVCSSDLTRAGMLLQRLRVTRKQHDHAEQAQECSQLRTAPERQQRDDQPERQQIGRASCRERACQYV